MSMVSSVVGGVDTHADVHVAAAIDTNGGVLGIESFSVDAAGYRSLLSWLSGFGPVVRVGVEGTGSYGVGLARHLHVRGSWWWRWIGRTGRSVASWGSRIRSTPRPQPGPRCPGRPRRRRSGGMGPLSRCGC